MGKVTPPAPAAPMTRDQVIAELERRGTGRALAVQYADAFVLYREADDNIRAHGAIVLHPRTNSPIENPYLKVRAQALGQIQKMRRVKADWLW